MMEILSIFFLIQNLIAKMYPSPALFLMEYVCVTSLSSNVLRPHPGVFVTLHFTFKWSFVFTLAGAPTSRVESILLLSIFMVFLRSEYKLSELERENWLESLARFRHAVAMATTPAKDSIIP